MALNKGLKKLDTDGKALIISMKSTIKLLREYNLLMCNAKLSLMLRYCAFISALVFPISLL